MATNNLKFFHVAKLPSTGVTGGIYFDKTAGEIAVWNGTEFEHFSGRVKDVTYDPVVDKKGKAVGGKLTITYFDGSNVETYKMIGNAVPPLFAKKLANAVADLLKDYGK